MHKSKLLNETEAAQILGVSVKTLRNWRYTRSQPLQYVKFGHLVRYRLEDVDAFILAMLRQR